MPRPLYPLGKSPWYPLNRRLGGPQSRSGRGGEEKNSQPPPAIEILYPDRSAPSPELYRLHRDKFTSTIFSQALGSHQLEYRNFKNSLLDRKPSFL